MNVGAFDRRVNFWIVPVGDLTHRVAFKLVTEINFAHIGLLASNLGKKVSRNLGAIQAAHQVEQNLCENPASASPYSRRKIAVLCCFGIQTITESNMSDPNLVFSGLSHERTVDGHLLRISICKLKDVPGWSLEVVDEDGASTVWDDLFDNEEAALEKVLKAIKEEGLAAFRDNGNVVQFPKK